MRRDHGIVAVVTQHRARLGDRLEPAVILGETKAVGCDGDRMGDLDDLLLRRLRPQVRAREIHVHGARVQQKAQRRFLSHVFRRLFPMLAAFDQKRVLWRGFIAEIRVIAHAPAGGMAFVHDHQLRHADALGQPAPLIEGA